MTQDEMKRAAELLGEWARDIYEGNTVDGEWYEMVEGSTQIQDDYEERQSLSEKLHAYAIA
jgi:hypothetical protein